MVGQPADGSVYALWWGGGDFPKPDISRLEVFASKSEADAQFISRALDGAGKFRYVSDEHPSGRQPTPGISRNGLVINTDTAMLLFFHDPRGETDPHPDRVIAFGFGKEFDIPT